METNRSVAWARKALLTCAALAFWVQVQAAQAGEPPLPRQWLLGVSEGQALPQLLRTLTQRTGAHWSIERPLLQPATWLIRLDSLPTLGTLQAPDALAATLQAVPGVRFAHPNYRLQTVQSATPGDPEFANRQNPYLGASTYAALNMASVWGLSRGSASQVIGVLDSGVLYGHPELRGRLLPGYDFVSQASPRTGTAETGLITDSGSNDGDGRDSDPSDPGDSPPTGTSCSGGAFFVGSSFHGTSVASVAVAQANNGGMVGVDWNAKVLPLRVTGRCGVGVVSDIVDALYWAIGAAPASAGLPANPNPATVINMSLSADVGVFQRCPPGTADSLLIAIAEARRRNIPVVVAGGNSGGRLGFPAACAGVIAATAVTSDGDYAAYSARGQQANDLTLSAPGDREGTYLAASNRALTQEGRNGQPDPNGHTLAQVQGTSFSAPMIAGLIALIRSIEPSLPVSDLIRILNQSAKPLRAEAPGSCGSSGLFNLGGSPCRCTGEICRPGIVQPVEALKLLRAEKPGPLPNVPHSRVYAASESTLSLDARLAAPGAGSPANALTYRWEQLSGFPLGLASQTEAILRINSGLANNLSELQLTVTDSRSQLSRKAVVRIMSNAVNEPAFSAPRLATGTGSPASSTTDSTPPGNSSNSSTDSSSTAQGTPTSSSEVSPGSSSASPSPGGGGGALKLWALLGMLPLLGWLRRAGKRLL